MGAGASVDAEAALRKASPDELKAALADLGSNELKKLMRANWLRFVPRDAARIVAGLSNTAS